MDARYILLQLITVVRIPLTIAIAVILLNFEHTSAVVFTCGVLLLFAELTDFLDGYLARRWEKQSEFGAMLDPYADSVSRMILFWGLACAGLALAVVPLVMALRDVTVAYCRVYWARYGKSASARWSGKVKAVVQGVCGAALLFVPLYPEAYRAGAIVVFSWITIVVTTYSAFDYFYAALALRKDEE